MTTSAGPTAPSASVREAIFLRLSNGVNLMPRRRVGERARNSVAMDIEQQIERIRADGEIARACRRVPGRSMRASRAARTGTSRHCCATSATCIAGRRPSSATAFRARLQRDFEGPSGREALLAWYRDGCAALIETLEAASPDDAFWFWGPAPNALAFWARRQANETAVHRVRRRVGARPDHAARDCRRVRRHRRVAWVWPCGARRRPMATDGSFGSWPPTRRPPGT